MGRDQTDLPVVDSLQAVSDLQDAVLVAGLAQILAERDAHRAATGNPDQDPAQWGVSAFNNHRM